MATRADFYVREVDGTMKFLGCSVNSYDGEFENAKNEGQFIKSVTELLVENHSVLGRWDWPWKTSKPSDEVFVFQITPKLFNKRAGKLYAKTHVKEAVIARDEHKLPIVPFKTRYDHDDEVSGATPLEYVIIIDLPTMKYMEIND